MVRRESHSGGALNPQSFRTNERTTGDRLVGVTVTSEAKVKIFWVFPVDDVQSVLRTTRCLIGGFPDGSFALAYLAHHCIVVSE